MNELVKMDLIGNKLESEILYQNKNVIVCQQDGIKWIVTKDNEILMTVKDIGKLGGNQRKAEDYERDLRNKEFIMPYKLNTKNPKYRGLIKKTLIGRKDGNMPILYNYSAITQIIAELRTDEARERNKQLGILQEQLRKGELKLISNKSFFEILSLKEPTKNHLKNRERWKNKWSTSRVNGRSMSVFLTLSRNEYLVELELANPYICSSVADTFNKKITGLTAKEFKRKYKIPENEDNRDYFNDIEIKAVMSAEHLFCVLVDKEKENEKELTNELLLNLATMAGENAHKEAISESKLLSKLYHDMTVQTDLFEVVTC